MVFIKYDLSPDHKTTQIMEIKYRGNASTVRPPYPEMLGLIFPICSGRICFLTLTAQGKTYLVFQILV